MQSSLSRLRTASARLAYATRLTSRHWQIIENGCRQDSYHSKEPTVRGALRRNSIVYLDDSTGRAGFWNPVDCCSEVEYFGAPVSACDTGDIRQAGARSFKSRRMSRGQIIHQETLYMINLLLT